MNLFVASSGQTYSPPAILSHAMAPNKKRTRADEFNDLVSSAPAKGISTLYPPLHPKPLLTLSVQTSTQMILI